MKYRKERGWHHAEFSKYVSGSIYGNIGRNPFPLYFDQSAGDSGAEDLQKSKIRNVCVELDIGEGLWRQSPSFFITGNLIDTFRGLGYDNSRKKENRNGAMEGCVEESVNYSGNPGGGLRIYPAAEFICQL